MRKRWIVVVTAAATLSIAACSSETTSSSPTTADASVTSTTTDPPGSSAPTKASYIDEATAICADMNAKAASLSEDYESGQRTSETTAAMFREQSSLIESTVSELRALPRPAGDEATLEAVYEAAAEIPPAADALADALESGDAAEVDRLGTDVDQITAAANDAADAYGLTECGSGASNPTA